MNLDRIAVHLAFRETPPTDPPSCLARDTRGDESAEEFLDQYVYSYGMQRRDITPL